MYCNTFNCFFLSEHSGFQFFVISNNATVNNLVLGGGVGGGGGVGVGGWCKLPQITEIDCWDLFSFTFFVQDKIRSLTWS